MQYLRSMGTDDSELDPEKYCERGLESYQSKERHNEIDLKRKLHVVRVIHEQARQSILGTKDPEQIRLMAASQSEGSLLRAQIRAALDQHEVQQALSNGGTAKTPSLEEVEAALEMHKKYLFAHAQMLEEQQRQKRDREERPIPTTEDLVDEDTPELTIAGTVPFASLFSEKSIFNPERGSSNSKSSIPTSCQSSPNRLIAKNEDGMGLRKISFAGLGRISSDRSSANADGNQATQSVTDFLRKARIDRQVQLSGVASRRSPTGVSNPSPMPLVSFGASAISGTSGTTTAKNNDLILSALSIRTNSFATMSNPPSMHNALFSIPTPRLPQQVVVSSSPIPCDGSRRLFLANPMTDDSAVGSPTEFSPSWRK